MVLWEPGEQNLLSVRVTVNGLGPLGGVLECGDGSRVPVSDGVPVDHTYAAPGTYQLTAWDRYGHTATEQVTVKDHAPRVVPFLDAEDDWRTLLWLDEPNDGTAYRINWGDGTSEETMRKLPPPHPRRPHVYSKAGQWTITVTDQSTRRRTTTVVETGEVGMVFTFPASPVEPILDALWLSSRARWHLDWGDGTHQTGPVPASGRVNAQHPGQSPIGRHAVTLTETLDLTPRRTATRVITIPTDWDWGLDVWMTWRRHEDPPGVQTVDVTPREATTSCSIDWGDGSPIDTVQPDGTASHTYRLPPPAAGWNLVVTELTEPPRRVFRRLLAVPRHVGQPVLNARTPGAVDLDIGGVDGPTNSDWYWVDWGDGAYSPVGGVGRWFPANHVYPGPGEYRITVDGPGLAKPIERAVTVREYPAPRITVREDRRLDDPGPRRSIAVEVDNAGDNRCGGPVEIRFGDGTTPVEAGETQTVKHTYGGSEPATYTVIATCLADRTAQARADVSVPFGDATTLEFEFSRHVEDPTGCTVELKVTAQAAGKTVQVDWGDGTGQKVPATGVVTHLYANPSAPEPDTYYPNVGYTDGSESHAAVVDIPFPETRSTP